MRAGEPKLDLGAADRLEQADTDLGLDVVAAHPVSSAEAAAATATTEEIAEDVVDVDAAATAEG
jgi:hypothetical protein